MRLNCDLAHAERLLQEGIFNVTEEDLARDPRIVSPLYGFHAEELRDGVEHLGCRVVPLSVPGALARALAPDVLDQILASPALYQRLLRLERVVAAYPSGLGAGTPAASGSLLLTARRDPDALHYRERD